MAYPCIPTALHVVIFWGKWKIFLGNVEKHVLCLEGVSRFGAASDASQKGANYLQKYLRAGLIHNKVFDIFPSSSAITSLQKKQAPTFSMFFHIMCRHDFSCSLPLLLGIDDGHQVVASQITSRCQTREATTNNQHTTPWPTNKLILMIK